jgi:hypothetical protein
LVEDNGDRLNFVQNTGQYSYHGNQDQPEEVIKQDCHQWKLTMASEISYASLKIARQVRESVSKCCPNV